MPINTQILYGYKAFSGFDTQLGAQSALQGVSQMGCEYMGGLNLAQAFQQASTTTAVNIPTSRLNTPTPKERTVFQEIKNDVSSFIKEHRGMIYFIALALLVDHFIFKGVFKARLQAMLESLIGKVEAKVAAS